jgi:hypothetical protein
MIYLGMDNDRGLAKAVLGDTDHESSYNLARRHRVDGSYDSGGTMISRKYAISSAGSDTDSDGRISKGV